MHLYYNELEDGIRLLELNGILDLQGVDLIEARFRGYTTGDGLRVFVDLSGVTFMASIGIRLLASTAKSLMVHNGKLGLINPISEVREVLEITGISEIIPIYPDLESAKAKFPAA
jgi:anti-anti-sigma factor